MDEGREMQVMVVEDDPMQRTLAVRAFEKLGFGRIHQAADGVDALARLAALGTPVDVALCDLQMDGMDGIELVRRLGEGKLARHVIVTSSADRNVLHAAESMARATGINVLGLIEKPVTREKLAARLAGLSRRGRRVADESPFSADELREAIAAGAIELSFQPKMALATGEIVGVEALARWRRGPHQLIPAERLAPVAEEGGCIVELTWRVLDLAMAAHAQWRREGIEIPIAVDLSHAFLADLAAADHIFARCNAAQVETRMVTFEVAEATARRDFVPVLSNLTRLRLRNFGLAIDDFGIGSGSLDQLSQIPFTELKVASRFVAAAATDAAARAILESSLDLARRLGLTSVAQGVESEWDLALVRKLPCDVVQGEGVAAPMAVAALVPWMRSRAPGSVHRGERSFAPQSSPG